MCVNCRRSLHELRTYKYRFQTLQWIICTRLDHAVQLYRFVPIANGLSENNHMKWSNTTTHICMFPFCITNIQCNLITVGRRSSKFLIIRCLKISVDNYKKIQYYNICKHSETEYGFS